MNNLTRTSKIALALSLVVSAAAFASVTGGCDGDDNTVHENPPVVDSGTPTPVVDSGGTMTDPDTGVITLPDGSMVLPDGAPAPDDCVMNPVTSDEIINACTDAARVDKKPVLPLLLADGGLPPLP